MKWVISLVLVVGLLSLPGSTMPAPAKKSCCGESRSAPACPRCAGEKSDCCQPVPSVGLLALELSKSAVLFHPPMPKIFLETPQAYPARAETPLLPPPKMA